MSGKDQVRPPQSELIPLLVAVEQSLDQEINLERLAKAAGYSAFHFHRRFSEAVGETPKRHVDRLRLSRAAYLLAITDDPVVDIALAVGFTSHEAFSRAFRRVVGHSPRGFRKEARAAQQERLERNRAFRGDGCLISEVRFDLHPETSLIGIRRLGPYLVDWSAERAALWAELQDWAERNGVAHGATRLGLFPDDPEGTPQALQRADICIPVAKPAADTQRIRSLTLPGGLYAAIEHFGPPLTVGQAYRNLADGVRRSPYAFREHPPLQIFHRTDPKESHSEIRFAVRKRA